MPESPKPPEGTEPAGCRALDLEVKDARGPVKSSARCSASSAEAGASLLGIGAAGRGRCQLCAAVAGPGLVPGSLRGTAVHPLENSDSSFLTSEGMRTEASRCYSPSAHAGTLLVLAGEAQPWTERGPKANAK